MNAFIFTIIVTVIILLLIFFIQFLSKRYSSKPKKKERKESSEGNSETFKSLTQEVEEIKEKEWNKNNNEYHVVHKGHFYKKYDDGPRKKYGIRERDNYDLTKDYNCFAKMIDHIELNGNICLKIEELTPIKDEELQNFDEKQQIAFIEEYMRFVTQLQFVHCDLQGNFGYDSNKNIKLFDLAEARKIGENPEPLVLHGCITNNNFNEKDFLIKHFPKARKLLENFPDYYYDNSSKSVQLRY